MKIAIDGYEANVAERLGSSQVAFELLKNFEKLDTKNEYLIFLPGKPLPDLPKERNGWRYKIVKFNKFWTPVSLPLALFLSREKFDLVFSPTHYLPKFTKIPKVAMIFDLSFLYYPKMFKKIDLWKLINGTRETIHQVDHIITISKFTKNDIVKNYQVPESKITIAYPGFNREIFKPVKDLKIIARVKEKYHILGDYLIFNGTIQPRKNLISLMEAFKEVLQIFPDLNLVLVGKIKGLGRQAWMNEGILKKPQELGIEQKVIFTDFIDSQDLAVLFSGARAFILPSLYEGFGIPVVEAMATGVPVAVSNVSSLPEVVDDAGLIFNPNSVSDIRQAILTLLSDKSQVKKLVKLGSERAEDFSWEKMAKICLDVFQRSVIIKYTDEDR